MSRDAYKILGVRPGSSEREIRLAYRKHAKEAHPDRSGDNEAFLAVRTAYEILIDPERKQLHDADPEGIFESQLQLELRRAQLKRRKARLRRLYE